MQMHGALEYFTAERSGINNKRDAGCVIADRSNRCSNGDAIPRLAGDRAGPRLRLQFRFRGASSEIFTCVRSRAFTVSSFARRIFLSLCHVATSLRTARVYDDSIPSSTAQPFARPISRDLPRDEPPSPSFRYIARRRGRTSTQGRGGGRKSDTRYDATVIARCRLLLPSSDRNFHSPTFAGRAFRSAGS